MSKIIYLGYNVNSFMLFGYYKKTKQVFIKPFHFIDESFHFIPKIGKKFWICDYMDIISIKYLVNVIPWNYYINDRLESANVLLL